MIQQQQIEYFGDFEFNLESNFENAQINLPLLQQEPRIDIFDNEFIEHDILQLYSERYEQQQQQQQIEYNQKIEELQNGIGKIKQQIGNHEQQLKEVNQSQQNSFSCLQKEMEHISEQQRKELKIKELKKEILQQRKKPIKKKKKSFKCQEANCSFESHKKAEVSRHVRKCHNYFGIQLDFCCRFCQQKFNIEEARDRHEKVYHKEQVEQEQTEINMNQSFQFQQNLCFEEQISKIENNCFQESILDIQNYFTL